jgi:hypothetical protein
MTIEEYEQALSDRYGGALLGKRFLDQLGQIASEELGEPVYIEQARVSVADRRLRIYKKLLQG